MLYFDTEPSGCWYLTISTWGRRGVSENFDQILRSGTIVAFDAGMLARIVHLVLRRPHLHTRITEEHNRTLEVPTQTYVLIDHPQQKTTHVSHGPNWPASRHPHPPLSSATQDDTPQGPIFKARILRSKKECPSRKGCPWKDQASPTAFSEIVSFGTGIMLGAEKPSFENRSGGV